jgi:hypothetical protein
MRATIATSIALVLGVVVMSGCTTRIGDMTVISSKTVNLDRIDIDKCPQTKNVVGRDSRFVFLFIPFGVPHLKDAVDDALAKGNGDLITDAAFYSTEWWFLIGEHTLEVRGTVVQTREQGK